MASSSAWMPVYLGDYLGKTGRLTTEQHGAYLLLIFDYWRNGPPPADDAVLAQITRLSRAGWNKMKPIILAFFDERGGLLHHKRVDEELTKAAENHDRRSDKARKAASARWSEHSREDASGNATRNASSNAPSMPQAMLDDCPPPSPKKKKASPKKNMALPDDWQPEPFGEGSEAGEIVAAWPDGEAKRQLERFRDHHRAKGSRFADWQAAWGTWVRNSVMFARPKSPNGAPPQRHFEDIVEEEYRLRDVAAGGPS